jgi:hypothetical protein
MATVLEEYNTEEQRSVVPFLWTRGLNAEDIHKEMFPIYGGKCSSLKAVHSWVEKRDKRFADDEEVETEVRKWPIQQSRDFYTAGFNALVNRRDKCSGGGYVEKFVFFSCSTITRFTFYIHW